MANSFLTPTVIAEAALEQFQNNLNMVGFVDRQASPEFANKVGDTVNIRRLTRFAAHTAADITSAIRDVVDGSVNLQLSQRRVVGTQIDSKELTLDLKDFTMQVVKPAMIELAQQVESDLADLYKQVWNQVGTPGTTPSTIANAMLPKQKLDLGGVPDDGQRSAFYEPIAATTLAATLGTVFPSNIAGLALEEGAIRRYAGFTFMQNQSIKRHTVGAYAGTPLVNGASQNVTYASVKDDYKQDLVTDGWTSGSSTLNEGDRFTIANVYAVNPKTRQSTGQLQQFVVRATISDTAGAKTISISPPIITSGAFQTVDSAPADNAAITVLGTASTEYPQNLAMHKNAFTVAFANLEEPMGGAKSARVTEDGISIRVVMGYDELTDKNTIRFDILYGVLAQNPGMACVHVG